MKKRRSAATCSPRRLARDRRRPEADGHGARHREEQRRQGPRQDVSGEVVLPQARGGADHRGRHPPHVRRGSLHRDAGVRDRRIRPPASKSHINPLVELDLVRVRHPGDRHRHRAAARAAVSFATGALPAQAATTAAAAAGAAAGAGAGLAQHVETRRRAGCRCSRATSGKSRSKLACWCGGCSKLPVGECACGHCALVKGEVTTMLKEGKTSTQILATLCRRSMAGTRCSACRPGPWLGSAGMGVAVVAGRRRLSCRIFLGDALVDAVPPLAGRRRMLDEDYRR